MDFGTPDCSLGKGTGITQEGEKKRPAQSVAMVTAGGVRSDLPRQLKDTELSGRLGGRHRSRGLCGGRECENNQITALSTRRLTVQRRLLFVSVK